MDRSSTHLWHLRAESQHGRINYMISQGILIAVLVVFASACLALTVRAVRFRDWWAAGGIAVAGLIASAILLRCISITPTG
jgi:hypothetical protein